MLGARRREAGACLKKQQILDWSYPDWIHTRDVAAPSAPSSCCDASGDVFGARRRAA